MSDVPHCIAVRRHQLFSSLLIGPREGFWGIFAESGQETDDFSLRRSFSIPAPSPCIRNAILTNGSVCCLDLIVTAGDGKGIRGLLSVRVNHVHLFPLADCILIFDLFPFVHGFMDVVCYFDWSVSREPLWCSG